MLAIVAGALRLVPDWVWAVSLAAVTALAGFTHTAWQREIAAHARDNAAADRRQADALKAEIERHNAEVAALKGVVQDANERTKMAELAADGVRAALASATADARRMRDANATGILAAEAAIAAAGATGSCAPAIEAARVRAGLLDRLDAVAERLAERAARLGGYADRLRVSGESCVRAYEVTD